MVDHGRKGRQSFWDPFQVPLQRDPGGTALPTIFNVVVDVVLRNWAVGVSVTEETADPRTYGFGWDIQQLAAYFYADDGLLVSTRAHRI